MLIQSYITKEDGIDLESAQGKKINEKKNYNQNVTEGSRSLKLPKPPKRSKYAGRVGRKANECIKLTNVKKGVEELTRKPSKIDTRNISHDTVTKLSFQVDGEVKIDRKSQEGKDEVHVAKKKDNMQDCKHGPPQNEREKETITLEDKSPDPKYWIRYSGEGDDETYIVLYPESKANILNKEGWLYDSEINAGLQLLKRQFPYVGGLVDPAIRGEMLSVETHEFVQVVNCGNHWICVSTIGCATGTVKVYDSGGSSRPNKVTACNTARMLGTRESCIQFIMQPVQSQEGSSDCGLFALAFATSLCLGEDPSSRRYHQPLMRQHYHDCLSYLRMESFPSTAYNPI